MLSPFTHSISCKYDICQGAENIAIHFTEESLRHKLTEFQYVCCNIPGPGTDTKPFEELIDGCTCTSETCNTSRESSCSCVQLSLASHCSDPFSHQNPQTLSEISQVECNSSCSCSQTCKNRIVQKGIQYRMEVFDDPDKGFGLQTLCPIGKHNFVCQYAGEVLDVEEARRRSKRQQKTHDMNYIFVLNEHFSSGLQTTYIDPRHHGNIGRFLNHSCDPNLILVPVRVDNFVPRLCLFAKRDVKEGEELTYNYGELEPGQGSSRSDSSRSGCFIPCHCKSTNCRGILPFDASTLGSTQTSAE